MNQILDHWGDYPMGPTVRRYLGIEDQQYRGATQPGNQRDEDFEAFMSQFIQRNPIESPNMAVDMVEEFCGMGQPYLALVVASVFDDEILDQEFRWHFALGNAAHMAGDYELAENYWMDAHRCVPEEPAPYVNLAELLFHQQRDEDALRWALEGLNIDTNNYRLWETIAAIQQEKYGNLVGEKIQELATARGSWAGISLAAMLIAPEDQLLRAQRLQELYDSGQRDGSFLVEFTAALGVALQYEKIPPIIWLAEKDGKNPLPWQLYAHGGQAQLALDEKKGAKIWIDKALQSPDLPDHARPELEELSKEADQH